MSAFRRSLNPERGGIITRFISLVFLVMLLFVLYLARHPLLRLAGSMLVVDENPRASDAIVILSDDNYAGDRATRAAQLLKAGWAPRIVASGRYLRPYASVAELERHDLTDRGVPASAIIPVQHHSENTLQECTAIGQVMAYRGWKHLLIVTSNYHTRRAEYICSRVLPSGFEMHVIAAPDSDYNPDNWWQSRKGIKIFLHEIEGFFVASWELRHNSVQTSASMPS